MYSIYKLEICLKNKGRFFKHLLNIKNRKKEDENG